MSSAFMTLCIVSRRDSHNSIYDLVVFLLRYVYISHTISTRFLYISAPHLVEINNIIVYFYNTVNPSEISAILILDKLRSSCYARLGHKI